MGLKKSKNAVDPMKLPDAKGLPGKPSLKKGGKSRSPVDNSLRMIDDVKKAGGSGDPYPLD